MALTVKDLKERLTYNPETGIFTYNSGVHGHRAGDISGYVHNVDGYIRIAVNGKRYLAHRLAFLYMTGSIPEYVDHIDRNKANNKWDNLRECTASENSCNRDIQSNNTSGFKGVSKRVRKGVVTWYAYAKVKGKMYNLGHWDTPEEAARVAADARERLHGEFVC